METTEPATRRRAVLVMGAAGVAGALAGCQVYGQANDAPPPPPPPPASGASDDGSDGASDDGSDGDNGNDSGGSGGTPVASVADVPVGGGLIVAEQNLVVTQPEAGDFKGFSAVCTHQGCTVNEVSDGTINCPCHNSRFSIVDGSVVAAANGGDPSQQDPLPAAGISVNGDTIELG